MKGVVFSLFSVKCPACSAYLPVCVRAGRAVSRIEKCENCLRPIEYLNYKTVVFYLLFVVLVPNNLIGWIIRGAGSELERALLIYLWFLLVYVAAYKVQFFQVCQAATAEFVIREVKKVNPVKRLGLYSAIYFLLFCAFVVMQ
ncbi:MAG: hypothetical protein ACK5ME_04470 [Parahaliea sp.]